MDIKKKIEEYREDLIRSTQEIIRIKSVEEEAQENMPFGPGPYQALDYILSLGESMGFKVKNLDGYAGYIEFGQGEESVGILGHVDVVPEGNNWDYPAYGGEIHNNRIYGRGSIDDKGPMIASLYGMKAIKDLDLKLNRRVRMIVGANEETHWKCMDYYFQHEEKPTMAFTPDADFPVIFAEKGIKPALMTYRIEDGYRGIVLKDIQAGTAKNMVAAEGEAVLEGRIEGLGEELRDLEMPEGIRLEVEETSSQLLIRTYGSSAHGSTPEKGRSALHGLMQVLGQVFQGEDSSSSFIRLYNERIGFFHHGEGLGADFSDEVSGSLSFNPGLISMEDGLISLSVDLRYPVTIDSDEIEKAIRENLADTKMSFEFTPGGLDPLYIERDNFLVEKLMDIYREETGDREAEPVAIGGGTYARALDNAVAFGAVFPGMEELAHQRNEYIEIDHLVKLGQIYARAIYELAK